MWPCKIQVGGNGSIVDSISALPKLSTIVPSSVESFACSNVDDDREKTHHAVMTASATAF